MVLSATTMRIEKDKDAPFPLTALRDRLGAATYAWLSAAAAASSGHPDDDEQNAVVDIFASSSASPQGEENDDEYYPRVQVWSNSRTDPDGVGGYSIAASSSTVADIQVQQKRHGVVSQQDDNSTILRVQYILSNAAGGHGDDLWAAARHASNLLADPVQCRRLLLPLEERDYTTRMTTNKNNNDEVVDHHQPQPQHHPLVGKRFVELGAGGGLPSWTALWCGARVVCTDQPIPDRIRALAEAAERNLQSMMKNNSGAAETTPFQYASRAKVCPYSWGTPVGELLNALPPNCSTAQQEQEEDGMDDDDALRFDVLIAADCIYMPDCHGMLLRSIQQLIKRGNAGVALLPFALHGNTPDENVWSIVQSARDIGFCVEQLEPQQLTPQSLAMDSKRALVHMLRLTLP